METIIDYEACATCGFDHAYEIEGAHRWHARETIAIAHDARIMGGMSSSAAFALQNAEELFSMGHYYEAAERAMDSLKYSVGILSPVYERAKALSGLV